MQQERSESQLLLQQTLSTLKNPNPFIISVRIKSTEMKSCNIPFQGGKSLSKISHGVCDENFLSLACYTGEKKVWSNNPCLENQSCGSFFWTLEVSHSFFFPPNFPS